MAILCSHCGVTLEKDDARFCQNCGKPVLPQSLAAPGYSASPAELPEIKQPGQNRSMLRVQVVKQPEGSQPLLQEQIARQPGQPQSVVRQQSARHPEQDKLPIRVQVVKQPEQDRPVLREQMAFQPSSEPKPLPRSEVLSVSASEQRNDELENAAVDIARPTAMQEDAEGDQAKALREVQEAVKTEEVIQRDKDEQNDGTKKIREKKKIEVSPKIPEAVKTKHQSGTTVSWPEPMTHVSVTDGHIHEKEVFQPEPGQEKTFTLAAPRTDPSVRELRVKVWDQSTVVSSVPTEAQKKASAYGVQSSIGELPSTPPPKISAKSEDSDVEDHPTHLLQSNSAESLASDQKLTGEMEADQSEVDGIEHHDTLHLPRSNQDVASHSTPSPQPAIVRENTPPPWQVNLAKPTGMWQQSLLGADLVETGQQSFSIAHNEQWENSVVAQPIPARFSTFPEAPSLRAMSSVPVVSRTHRRLSVALLAVVLVVLVLIGLGSWIFIAQPFSVPEVTQPQVSFSDTNLRLSLLYPNGWTYQKDATNSTIRFYDSSHTAQVIIAASNTNIPTTTITAYLQKQAAQLGISGAKGTAPLSFAGASWQGLQGTVQQSGANYTCAIFVTTHANHLVMLTQLAPQSVYDDENNAVFSSLRQSLHFL